MLWKGAPKLLGTLVKGAELEVAAELRRRCTSAAELESNGRGSL